MFIVIVPANTICFSALMYLLALMCLAAAFFVGSTL